MATKKKRTQLVVVPPGGFAPPSPEEVLRARRKAAREAVEHIKRGEALLREAQVAFGAAMGLATEHKLPGASIHQVRGLNGRPDPEAWPGVRLLTYEEWMTRIKGFIDPRREDMKELKKGLHGFLRETKDSSKP